MPRVAFLVPTMFRSLRARNFRLFFVGQSISLVGTWMQQVATSWLVYRLTNSSFLLGVTAFANLAPTFFLAPIAGVLADRFSRHRMVIVTQTLFMIQALAFAILVITGTISVAWVLGLSFFFGFLCAFDIPSRQSFLVELIENKDDLSNAIALHSIMFNGARFAGPALAGILMKVGGEGLCFGLNALSYAAVLAALLAMRIAARPGRREKSDTAVWHGLKEGLKYSVGFKPVFYLLLLLGIVSFAGMPYTVLLPVFARDILKGGPETLGFLVAANGIGAFLSALYLASRKSVVGLTRLIPAAVFLFGACLVLFSFSTNLWWSMALMLVAGMGLMIQMNASNIIIQTLVEDRMRGRVMSFYTMAFIGMTPFGGLAAGAIALRIGAPTTVLAGAVISCLGAAYFAAQLPKLRNQIRPVYVAKGILPGADIPK